ncbi:MAG: hypothetical protein RR911_04625 [Oscillospiraceae bacterium]
MDDRRRTISSEEQIGEALMRVSNTLEAQRLTKSLEYQEKLRRRTVFRMVISIILAITLFMLLIVGGVLLFVLWKYMDPILGKVLPFFDAMLGDFGTIWRSLVDSSTYLPSFLEQFSRLTEELITLMHNMNGMPLKALLGNLNNLLATTNGLLVGTSEMLSGLSKGMSVLGTSLAPMLDQLGAMMSDMTRAGSVMANVMAGAAETFGKAMSQIDMNKMVQALSMAIDKLPAMIESGSNALLSGANSMGKIFGELDKNSDSIGKIITNIVGATEGMSKAMAALAGIFGK